MKKFKMLYFLLLLLVLCTTLMPLASAHRVYLLEQVNEVQIQSWYGGGTAMADAEVEIYSIKDGQEELYLEGKTDADGMFYFTPKLGVSEYRAVVSATGHRADKVFDLAGGGQQEEAEIPVVMKIFAGFGYLIGLAGIAMYLSTRKLKNKHSNN